MAVRARSALLTGQAQVRTSADRRAALVVGPDAATLLGGPDPDLLRTLLAGPQLAGGLLVQAEASQEALRALPGWEARTFTVHALPRLYVPRPAAEGVVVSIPLDPTVLRGLPADVRADAEQAPGAAVRFVDGAPVAVCTVSDRTDRLWDVGIDTVEPARRQGHGTAVFEALASAMAERGHQPVWAAYDDYPPSLLLARRLGFTPLFSMADLRPAGMQDRT